MKRRARVHLRGRDAELEEGLCGILSTQVTVSYDLATCRLCRRIYDESAPPEQLSIPAAIEYALRCLRGPVVEPYPAMTPDAWASMRCRGEEGYACGCVFCAWEMRHRAAVDNWRIVAESVRPHARHPHPFGSVNAALEFLAAWRESIPLRSSMGGVESRGVAVRELGTEVQTTQRYDRDVTTERAGLAVDVERALGHAESCADPTHSTAAREVSVRKAITVELAARGLIPEPRARLGLQRQIDARRAALRATEVL